ncbi:unnamed protein product, partial [Brassica rapa]
AVNSVKIFIVSFTCQDDVRESKGIRNKKKNIFLFTHLNNMSIFFVLFLFLYNFSTVMFVLLYVELEAEFVVK